MKKSKYIFSLILGVTLLVGCNNTPDKVLPQEEMAQLLADIHIGESVVDVERTTFYNDSLRKTVKQSILVKHNVTQEELDSSFSWYGRNIEEYIAVYDRVIEILNEDLTQIGPGIQEKVEIAQEGDSIDVWQDLRHYAINNNSASQYITFSLPKDHHSLKGDYFTWKMKLINNPSPIKWGIAADYSDGSTEYINATVSNEGWNNLKFVSDSTKTLNRLYGYVYIIPNESQQIYIDSISLVRMRVDRNMYRQRVGQKVFEYGKNKKNVQKTEPSNASTTNNSTNKSSSSSTNSLIDKSASNTAKPHQTNSPTKKNSNNNTPSIKPQNEFKSLKLKKS